MTLDLMANLTREASEAIRDLKSKVDNFRQWRHPGMDGMPGIEGDRGASCLDGMPGYPDPVDLIQKAKLAKEDGPCSGVEQLKRPCKGSAQTE